MTPQDFPKGFAGTEHYRERVEERTLVDGGCVLTSVAHHRINPGDYREDVLALCDYIDELLAFIEEDSTRSSAEAEKERGEG